MRMNPEWENRFIYGKFEKDKLINMYLPSELFQNLHTGSTQKIYMYALKKYLEIIRSKQIGCAYLDSEWMDYLSSNPNITADFVTFSNKANTEYGLMPKTVRLYGQTVLMYLRECEIEIPDRDLRRIKRSLPSNHPISREAELDANKIRTLLKHSDLRMKAILTIALSSGMRIGEILKFKTSDINFETTPVEIFLSGDITKTKEPRRVFISSQAAVYLKKWLAESDALSSDRICFPYSASTEITRLKKLLKKCDLYEKDTRTGRTTIHFHLFRKFFLTEFKLVASADAAEELAGHKGYLDESYRRLTQKQLREEYLKAETRLTIDPVEGKDEDADNYEGSISDNCDDENAISMADLTLTNRFLKLERHLSEIKDEIKQLNEAYARNTQRN